jgi:hypothetical protein
MRPQSGSSDTTASKRRANNDPADMGGFADGDRFSYLAVGRYSRLQYHGLAPTSPTLNIIIVRQTQTILPIEIQLEAIPGYDSFQ